MTGSGSFSHTTDSEHNSTAPSEDLIKEEVNEAAQNPAQSPTVFKSPLPEKKKKLKRKKRKSHAIPASDDDDGKSLFFFVRIPEESTVHF